MLSLIAMQTMSPAFIALGFIGVLLLMYFLLFNSLIYARNKVQEAWSGIDVQLKRRHDVIPNLVAVVQAYATHEQELLKRITEERSKAMALPTGDIAALGSIEQSLGGMIHTIVGIAEQYPDLKANQNFLQLQSALSNAEDQIAAARAIYNSNVRIFNSKVESFPTLLVARVHHFTPIESFQGEAHDAAVPSSRFA